ncbi:thiol-disulfide oxidoreductase ResA [Bacillus cereus]|uniref:Thiol-disulfide oxidoreductase ResA n=2 Tax=Bacillus cereus group TaxID=86661 RepID=A0A1C4DJ33_BACCE|nr:MULTISPECIES: thiol-disulfide oxidoreductase ResA [Bacillus]EOP98689.1 thiol-disulfide oxidoreductase [Bacillus cereus VD140]MBL3889408.1 thiol-disulfide oxidoreductase ResA [Bacillus cereus]MCC2368523.1 thiol-disulfide oxidoreductase ResA [Bacillus cereus]MCC2396604.1 thiol-disulfide oxidoreductase ResA [Bacillus cereus]MCC2451513.1 thiol-disulfide oxidoreductase ResA [Bacillus cereus]
MKKKQRFIMRILILLILLGALGYTLYINFFVNKEKVQIGSQAPNFVLVDLEGKKHQLSDYRGKGVFLNFWGTWCKPCEKEMPYMNELYPEYKKKGIEILAVDADETEIAVKSFRDQYKLSFPIMIDKGNEVLNTYGVGPIPATYLIDKNGKVVKIFIGGMTLQDIKESMDLITP